MPNQVVIQDEWPGLYGESWSGVIHPDAFAHPAKYSRALIRKIYEHVIAERWVSAGDSVIDPFGGVALGGFDAMQNGLHWYGCELEQKFVDLGNQNIALWNDKYSRMPKWGTARLIQGDSRNLREVFASMEIAVSSPPFLSQIAQQDRNFRMPHDTTGNVNTDYGSSEGQLGAMKEGDFGLAVSSPPYIDSMEVDRNGIDWDKIKPDYPGRIQHEHRKAANDRRHRDLRYGSSGGQLGAMREGDHSIAISSPPFPQPYKGGGGINKRGYGDGSDKVGDRTYQSKGGERDPGNLETMEMGSFDAAILGDSRINSAYNEPHEAQQKNGKSAKHGDHHRSIQKRADNLSNRGTNGQQPRHDSTALESDKNNPLGLGGNHHGIQNEATNSALVLEREKANCRPRQEADQGGNRALELQRRKGISCVSEDCHEEELRCMPQQTQSGDSPQRSRSFQQRSAQPSGALQELPPPSSQEHLLESKEGGQNPSEVERADSLAEIAISSPPFMENGVNIGSVGDTPSMRQQIHNAKPRAESYGSTSGQLGNQRGEDFWSASRLILEQLHSVIVPGGHAVFVTKRFVRNKQIVEFTSQWIQLCEAVGFRLIHRHKALLTESYGAQHTLDGETQEIEVARKSFFRRLCEAKGSPKIDWEDVSCFVKS